MVSLPTHTTGPQRLADSAAHGEHKAGTNHASSMHVRTGNGGPMNRQADIGELISIFYAQFLAQYGDAEVASVATAAVINDMLAAPASPTAHRAVAQAA